VAKSSYRDFCSSEIKCKPLVLAGNTRAKASLVPFAAVGAVNDDVALNDFLGADGALEVSPICFLPIVEIMTDLDPRGGEKSGSRVNFALYNLEPQQLRFWVSERESEMGFEECEMQRGGIGRVE